MKNLLHQSLAYSLVLLSASSAYGRPYSSKHTHYHQDGTHTTCTYEYNSRTKESSSRCYTLETPTIEQQNKAKSNIGKGTEEMLDKDFMNIKNDLLAGNIDNACSKSRTASYTIKYDVFRDEKARQLYKAKLKQLMRNKCDNIKPDLSKDNNTMKNIYKSLGL